MTDDEPDALQQIAQKITVAIESADSAPANVVAIDAKRKGRRRRATEVEPGVGAFSVEDLNREYALVIMGSKAVIVKENDDGPIEDRLQFLTIGAFEEWFANRYTEIRDANGKVRSVTWSTAWRRHRSRRSFSGLEFFPNPDGAPSTPGYLNLWRGFAFAPRPKPNGWKTLRDHIFSNVCSGNEQHFNWIVGFFAHLERFPHGRNRQGIPESG